MLRKFAMIAGILAALGRAEYADRPGDRANGASVAGKGSDRTGLEHGARQLTVYLLENGQVHGSLRAGTMRAVIRRSRQDDDH